MSATIDFYHMFDRFAEAHGVIGAGVLSNWINDRNVFAAGSLPEPKWDPERTMEFCEENEDVYRDELAFTSTNATISIVAEHRFVGGSHVACNVTCFRDGKCNTCGEFYEESHDGIMEEWLEDTCERCR